MSTKIVTNLTNGEKIRKKINNDFIKNNKKIWENLLND